MKIYIGPYRNHHYSCRIADKFLEKKYGKTNYWTMKNEEFDRVDRALEKVEGWIQDILNLTINKLTAKQERKVKIRIDKYDTWSMDHTLALIVVPMLKQLKATKHGSPFVDDLDVPEELRSSAARELTQKEKDCGHTDDLFHKRWEWVLDEMIYAFESEVDDDWDEQFESGVRDWKSVEKEITDYGTGCSLEEGPNHTFKVDEEARQAAWKRRKNGMLLFGKYYNSLWD